VVTITFYLFLLLQNQSLAQEPFKNYFDKVAVTGLCETGQYFYECFEKQKDCQIRMRSFVQVCLSENRKLLNKKISESHLIEISPQLSLRMGMCLGNRFEKQFKKEKKSHSNCFQSDVWSGNE